MDSADLKGQAVQRVHLGCMLAEDLPALTVYGIHGGSDHVTAICVDGLVLEIRPRDPIKGTPAESVDQLTMRAMRDLVPKLTARAPRDELGRAMGYLIYHGLPHDHCKPR